MLEELYIDGFRHFRNCAIPLNSVQMICGRNGTGKTTIIELLARLHDFLEGGGIFGAQPFTVNNLCSINDIPRWEKKDFGKYTSRIGFRYSSESFGRFEYEVKIDHNFRDDLNRVIAEKITHDGAPVYTSQEGDATVSTDDNRKREFPVDWKFSGLSMGKRFNKHLRNFSKIVAGIIPLSLDPRSISAIHDAKSDFLALSGSNFSSWYDHLRDKYDKEIVSVYSEYENFIAGFDRLRLDTVGKSQQLRVDCYASASETFSLSFDELSHGQKILCVLYLLLKTAPTGSTILIDEFENYLSPKEFEPFYNNALVAASEKNLQIILVSHHEKTLNWYHDQALLFFLDPASPATVRFEKHDPMRYPGSLSERIEMDGE